MKKVKIKLRVGPFRGSQILKAFIPLPTLIRQLFTHGLLFHPLLWEGAESQRTQITNEMNKLCVCTEHVHAAPRLVILTNPPYQAGMGTPVVRREEGYLVTFNVCLRKRGYLNEDPYD